MSTQRIVDCVTVKVRSRSASRESRSTGEVNSMQRRRFSLSIGVVTALAVAFPVAQVATAPTAGAIEPGSVGAAAASSWQTNATVWHMVYANGDIWMVGDFTNLRPPGAAAGVSTQPANYFAALNASTGAPDTAVNDTHTFTGQASGLPLTVGTVAASPD